MIETERISNHAQKTNLRYFRTSIHSGVGTYIAELQSILADLQLKVYAFSCKKVLLCMSVIISGKVINRIYGHGKGWVFNLSDFSDIANSATIRSGLARNEKKGIIRRLMRGIYDYPSESKLLNELSPPDPDKIAQAIARSHGWTILPGGNTALNLLGLSTQVSSTWEYLSGGPYRSYEWFGNTMKFKHRTNKEITILSPKTALLVQALKALGEQNVDDNVVKTISKKLDKKERKKILKEAMYVTDWVYERIRQACELESMDSE